MSHLHVVHGKNQLPGPHSAVAVAAQRLLNQQKISINDPFKCRMCDIAFDDSDGLREHMGRVHQQPLYICASCSKTYQSTRGLARHIRKYHPKDKEPVCLRTSVGASRKCCYCGCEVPSKQLDEHEQACNEAQKKIAGGTQSSTLNNPTERCVYMCPSCDNTYLSTGRLNRHILKHHPELYVCNESQKKDEEEKTHACNACRERFPSRDSLLLHVSNCTHPAKSSAVSALTLKKAHTCNGCLERFPNRDSMLIHILHCSQKNNDAPTPSDACSVSEFDSTKRSFTLTKEEPEEPPSIPTRYRCNMCDVTFANLEEMRKHMSTVHKNGSRLKCAACSKTFAVSNSLRRHFRAAHLKCVCKLCGKSYTQNWLSQHTCTGVAPSGKGSVNGSLIASQPGDNNPLQADDDFNEPDGIPAEKLIKEEPVCEWEQDGYNKCLKLEPQ